MLPAISKKRKMSEISSILSARTQTQSHKAFEILTKDQLMGTKFEPVSKLTQRPRKFDVNRKTLFMKPKHQVSQSKLMSDTSIDLDDLSKTRPFSLEERNFNINDISFTRILRSENSPSCLNSSRFIGKPQPPSFYEKDINRWKQKFDNAVKNREKLQKIISAEKGAKTER